MEPSRDRLHLGLPPTFPAVSLWPPWGTLIAKGYKRAETRHWPTRVRGWIAIHQTCSWKQDVLEMCHDPDLYFKSVLARHYQSLEELPLGSVVAMAKLTKVLRTDSAEFEAMNLPDLERAFGDYSCGRWAWVFSDVYELPEPQKARGRQSVWPWHHTGLPVNFRNHSVIDQVKDGVF